MPECICELQFRGQWIRRNEFIAWKDCYTNVAILEESAISVYSIAVHFCITDRVTIATSISGVETLHYPLRIIPSTPLTSNLTLNLKSYFYVKLIITSVWFYVFRQFVVM